jgi:hypothetical protein
MLGKVPSSANFLMKAGKRESMPIIMAFLATEGSPRKECAVLVFNSLVFLRRGEEAVTEEGCRWERCHTRRRLSAFAVRTAQGIGYM